jgi:hypothetical protein
MYGATPRLAQQGFPGYRVAAQRFVLDDEA